MNRLEQLSKHRSHLLAERVRSNHKHFRRQETFLLLAVVAAVFLWSEGFGLRMFHLSDRFRLLNLVGLFLIVGLAIFRVLFHRSLYFKSWYFRALLGVVAVVLFPTFVNLVLVNGLNVIEVFRSGLLYAGFAIFIVLSSFRTSDGFVTRLNHTIVLIAITDTLLLLGLSFFPTVSDALLVNTSSRFGVIRITPWLGLTPLVLYSTLYSLVMCTKPNASLKTTVLYAVLLGIFLWAYFFLFMGRRSVLMLLVVMSYYIVFFVSTARKLKITYLLLLLFALSASQSSNVLGLFSDMIQTSTGSVQQDYNHGGGTLTIRLQGIEYYLDEARRTFFFGTGLPSTRLSSNNGLRLGRELYGFNPADHGFFAVIYQFGFLGVGLTLVILLRMFKDLSMVIHRGLPEHRAIAQAIRIYLIASMVSFQLLFWKPSWALWSGILFFMIWRMRVEIIGHPSLPFPKNRERRSFVKSNKLEAP